MIRIQEESSIDPGFLRAHTDASVYVTQSLESGYGIRTVQELLGHSDIKTTQVYTHALNRGGQWAVSPTDRIIR